MKCAYCGKAINMGTQDKEQTCSPYCYEMLRLGVKKPTTTEDSSNE